MEKIPENYNYVVPTGLIADAPVSPRERARLLVFDRAKDGISFDTFLNLDKYLPKDSVLVFNDTKVLPARLIGQKKTGGQAKILYLKMRGKYMEALSEKTLKEGEEIFFRNKKSFQVREKKGSIYLMETFLQGESIENFLRKNGKTPLPPYIKSSPLQEKDLRREYQSVFAKKYGSSAAPTASLHFSKALLGNLKRKGFKMVFVTLHVGLGTFATLTEENIKSGKLHREYFEVNVKTADILNRAKKEGRSIVAVGTTSARTLESAAEKKDIITKFSGETDLFISPGYKWKFVDHLVTNFHVPKSSLMMMVASMTGREKLLSIYERAIKNKLRFYSFGDGMLII